MNTPRYNLVFHRELLGDPKRSPHWTKVRAIEQEVSVAVVVFWNSY